MFVDIKFPSQTSLTNIDHKIDVKDNTVDDFLHIGLAPSFGNLKDGSTWKVIDDELLIMIASTFKDLDEMPPEKRSWDAVTNAFMQNPCLEPDSAAAIHRSDKLIKQSSGDFKFDGSPDNSIVEEVIGGPHKRIKCS